MDEKTGTPTFVNGGLPPSNQIPVSTPQIYFGQNSPSYSIVGQPPGSTDERRVGLPEHQRRVEGRAHDVRRATVACRSARASRRLLFAIQMHDPNIFFSSEINGSSQLLTVRNPRTRVAKVAPWLTLDGDVYPAVVDGHVELGRGRLHVDVELPRLAARQPAQRHQPTR